MRDPLNRSEHEQFVVASKLDQYSEIDVVCPIHSHNAVRFRLLNPKVARTPDPKSQIEVGRGTAV